MGGTNKWENYTAANDTALSWYSYASSTVVLKLASTGAATFSGLITGTNSIYQSNASGQIASNNWSVYNGGATDMNFFYNASGTFTVQNGTTRFQVASTGNVLIGTTTDYGYKLALVGNMFIRAGQPQIVLDNIAGASNLYNISFQRNDSLIGAFGVDSSDRLAVFGSAASSIGYWNNSTGVYVATSDYNKKKDIELSTIGLNAILGLKPSLYRMKVDSNSSDKYLGFIAQEVKNYIPQAYQDNGNFIGLDYQPIIATVVKGMQEQQAQIEELKNKLNNV